MKTEKSIDSLLEELKYVNLKKQGFYRLSKEINDEIKKLEKLLYYQMIFNAVAIPTLIYNVLLTL